MNDGKVSKHILEYVKKSFLNPGLSPGKDWIWKGKLPKGSEDGYWFNKKTGETIRHHSKVSDECFTLGEDSA